jgi:hypothetical protein
VSRRRHYVPAADRRPPRPCECGRCGLTIPRDMRCRARRWAEGCPYRAADEEAAKGEPRPPRPPAARDAKRDRAQRRHYQAGALTWCGRPWVHIAGETTEDMPVCKQCESVRGSYERARGPAPDLTPPAR